MSWFALIITMIAVQFFFLALDLIDRHLTRDSRYGGDRLTVPVALFFMVVIFVYLGIQSAGFRAVPSPDWLFTGLRDSVGQYFSAPMSDETFGGFSLLFFSAGAFYLAGFYDYLFHRFVSHSRFFWFTHEYHHTPNQVFLGAPGIGARPFAVVIIFPNILLTILSLYLILLASGKPLYDLSDFKIVFLIQGVIAIMSHSSCLRRWLVVHNAMKLFGLTTPQEHVLHHTIDLDGNYSNFTTLWDRVFGTYLDPLKEENKGHKLGLKRSKDFLQVVTLGVFRIPEGMRKRFKLERYCNLD